MSRLEKNLLLIGSVPLATIEDVFRLCGEKIGQYVPCLPDGEVGDRENWIDYLAYRIYSNHPDIDVVNQPTKTGEPDEWKSTDPVNMYQFTLKPGVTNLRFDDMGYGNIAIESYQAFRKERAEGHIPPDVKFQFAIPMPYSGIILYWRRHEDWPVVVKAYQDGIRREIDKILEHVPAEDLVLQWDFASETLDFAGLYPWSQHETLEEKIVRSVEPIAHISPQIPDDVALGYHWCYGTLGGWPMTELEDFGLTTRLSNEAVARSGRRVDYVHMPAPYELDDAFCAPLAGLDIGDTKVFLGIVHHEDGVDGFRRRLDVAQKYLSGFGVAAACGYGRMPADAIPGILDVHAADAQELARRRAG